MTRGLGVLALALVFVVAGCASASPPPAPPAALDRSELIRKILASIVQLKSERHGAGRRAASGVVVATDRRSHRTWIVTVRHFLTPPHPQSIFVQLPDEESAVPATVLALSAADFDLDLAIIEVENLDLEPVQLKEVGKLGDEVFVIAFPWGQRFTVARGIVSQLGYSNQGTAVTGPVRMIDASVSYGSSGGGVFDAHTGELVGIVETYRTARIAVPDLKNRSLDVPVPGETTLVPASTIRKFIEDFGLRRRLEK